MKSGRGDVQWILSGGNAKLSQKKRAIGRFSFDSLVGGGFQANVTQ